MNSSGYIYQNLDWTEENQYQYFNVATNCVKLTFQRNKYTYSRKLRENQHSEIPQRIKK